MTEVWAGAALCEYCLPVADDHEGVHRLGSEYVGDPSTDMMAMLRMTGALEHVWAQFVADVKAIDPRMSMVADDMLKEITRRHRPAFKEKGVHLFYCKTTKMRDHNLSSWFEFVDLKADKGLKHYRPADCMYPPASACIIA